MSPTERGTIVATGEAELVSVVIPAYNAEETLDETLVSARRQTYPDLEIIVVNDGSTDGTERIAQRHAAEDPRVSVVTVGNGGVAAARNVGIARARGELIAPLDADDLWHPDKIALQVAEMRRGGPSTGFVYTGFRRIDPAGRVMGDGIFYEVSGRAFLRGVFINFVGNGSALLLRRAALDEVGGYEPGLRAVGLQGAEDRLVQVQIARNWTVGVVPEYATGYRHRPDAMSRDNLRMLKSQLMVLDRVADDYPDTPGWVLDCSRSVFEMRLAVELVRRRQFEEAGVAFRRACTHSRRAALSESLVQIQRSATMTGKALLRRLGVGTAAKSRHFYEVPPRPVRRRKPTRYRWLMARLEAAEGEMPLPAPKADAAFGTAGRSPTPGGSNISARGVSGRQLPGG